MRRTSAVLFAALALVVAACGNDADVTEPTVPPDPTEPADPAEPGPAWVTCTNDVDGYAIDHPPDWTSNDGEVMAPCSLFDPEPIDVPPATEIPLDLAVSIVVDPAPFDDVSSPDPFDDELDRASATVDGRDAVRVEVRGSGEGFLPDGVRATRWVVDLGDERTLTASTHDVGQPPYTETQDVLDRMIDTLELVPDGPTTTTTEPDRADDPDGPDPIGATSTETTQSDDFPAGFGDTAFLQDVRVSPQAAGFDRIVLELEGDARPSYRVSYLEPPIREDGSGNPVQVEGSAFLELRLEPASGVDLGPGGPTEHYTGPTRIEVPGGHVVTEVVRTGDFESNMGWVAGLDAEAPFAVALLDDPLRLVVDVVPGG